MKSQKWKHNMHNIVVMVRFLGAFQELHQCKACKVALCRLLQRLLPFVRVNHITLIYWYRYT